MCGQSTAYNTYATLPYTNPLFMGFSCSQNVIKEIIFALAMSHATVNMKRLRPCLHGAKSFCIYWHRAKPATEMKRKRNRGGAWRSSGWETDLVFVLLKSAP